MATHYNFRRGKYGELNDELNQTNWEILEGMKVQAAWDYKKEKPYSATDCIESYEEKEKMMISWWSKWLKQEVKRNTKHGMIM